jgi:hypothetical protein
MENNHEPNAQDNDFRPGQLTPTGRRHTLAAVIAVLLAIGAPAMATVGGQDGAVAATVGTSADTDSASAQPTTSLARFDEVELVESLTPEEQVLVDWATGRFTQAGLELPELTVRFDPTRELCNNADGLYRHGPNQERVVTVCTPDFDTFAAQLGRRRTLLHEFGHAWDFANMSPQDHHELGQILGTDSWSDQNHEWEDRGVERFAETFVFALLDQPRRQLKVSLECSDLLGAFNTATGTQPLGPGLPPCAGEGQPEVIESNHEAVQTVEVHRTRVVGELL